MSFDLVHTLVASQPLKPHKHTDGEIASFRVSTEGEFAVLFPGRIVANMTATFFHRIRIDAEMVEGIDEHPHGGTQPLHGGFQSTQKQIPLTLRIFMPDGAEFAAPEITLADLDRFRDRRLAPKGNWRYRLTGESKPIFVDANSTIVNATGRFGLRLTETVRPESAPALLDAPVTALPHVHRFDLFRVGRFTASLTDVIGTQWQGSMRLLDPDGVAVAATRGPSLKFDVDLFRLDKSRDTQGRVREWTLEVAPNNALAARNRRVRATVFGAGRIEVAALHTRIDALLGPRGQFIQLFGENADGDAIARLLITDVASAETIDMHGILDKVLDEKAQDAGVDAHDVQAHTLYTLGRRSEKLAAGLSLDVGTLRVQAIDFAIGPGIDLGPSVPVVRLTVSVSGAAKVEFVGAPLASARIRGGRLAVEVGLSQAPDGTPVVVTAVPDSPFDLDIDVAGQAALLLTLGVSGLIGGLTLVEYLESEVNGRIVQGVRNLFSDPTLAPRILMTIFGAHLKYSGVRFENEAIVLDYVAPLEPDPKPTPGYQGAIGRSFTQLTPNAVSFRPPLLGDTWAANNLAKIDHIVVVMMENRSYDHVLGYRARDLIGEPSDGLTSELVTTIEATSSNDEFPVRPLREAAFAANAANLKTRLPKSVGHDLKDVEQQLSVRALGPAKREINSPTGFVANFKPRLGDNPQGVVPSDVLGFYDELDLPFFAYLAEHYAYCDRYFCSHPGPTLPNRMYSLTGNVQHDRYGFPILDNNNTDDFVLSRAATIYDFLARKGLTFRVYESFPSVTQLRLFARYAGDNTNIVPFDRLADDISRGDLPAFTFIEPQMHAHPQSDDHPDADMLRGQIFLKRVYDTLRSNEKVWRKTLLIITYDEHGGFYDHAVPPVADVFSPKLVAVADETNIDGASTTLTSLTASGALSGARSFISRETTAFFLPGEGPEPRPPLERPRNEPPLGPQPPRPTAPSLPTAPATGPLLAVPYGLRVPTFVVSPWVRRGLGPSITLDHCSILKTVLARFWGGEKPFLSDRVHSSHSFNAFLTETTPRMDIPESPTLPSLPPEVRLAPSTTTSIETMPLSRATMRAGPVDYHELSGRWARQLGR